MEYLFLLGRIIVGGFFLYNAYGHFKNVDGMAGYAQSKGMPMPKASVIVSGIMMLLGGLGIILGVYVALSVLLLVVFLLGTLVKMHTYWKVEDPMARMGEQTNFYKNLALIGALLMFLSIPTPWVMSLVF